MLSTPFWSGAKVMVVVVSARHCAAFSSPQSNWVTTYVLGDFGVCGTMCFRVSESPLVLQALFLAKLVLDV